jgi:hypothetical protein
MVIEAAERRRRLLEIREAVEALLRADAFDAAAVDALARRHVYADAASYLLGVVSCRGEHDLISHLHAGTFAAPYRFGVAFGAVASERDFMEPFGVDALRALGTPAARLALVTCGESVDWATLDRRGRAVFALRHLIMTMRNR